MRSVLKATAVSLATIVALAAPASAELTGNLKINLDTSNPAPRATMEALIAKFQAANPALNITTNVIDREAYKTQIRNFLSADAPDVLTWYAANRMKPYVEAGLLEDVSDMWADGTDIANELSSTKGALTVDGKQWASRIRTTSGEFITEKISIKNWASQSLLILMICCQTVKQ